MPENAQGLITFTREKVTTNTVRYIEDPVPGKAPVIGSLYVQKWFAGENSKIEIKLTLKS